MISNKIYLIEIVLEDMPYSELNNILDKLSINFTNKIKKDKIMYNFFFSYITLKRIIFHFSLDNIDNDTIINKFFNVLYETKFETNMRWAFSSNSFIRPLLSCSIICNKKFLNYKIFDIESLDYTYIFKNNISYIKKIGYDNYFKFLKENKVIIDFKNRYFILKKKIKKYYKKKILLLDEIIFLNIVNSFEYPVVMICNFNLYFDLPLRIINLVLLSYEYIPILSNNKINEFLIILNQIKLKTLKNHSTNIENKLYDIELLYKNDKSILLKINILYLRNFNINKVNDSLYFKIKRIIKIMLFINKFFDFNLIVLRKCIILINIELLSKIIIDYQNFSGLLFVKSFNGFIDKILYGYNSIINGYLSKYKYSNLLYLIQNIDEILNIFIFDKNVIKNKKDPLNFKKKINTIIKIIIDNKINLNLLSLFYYIVEKRLYFLDIKSIYNLYNFFLDRLKYNFDCKYFLFIKKKKSFFLIHLISFCLKNFFNYNLKIDFLKCINRIHNFIVKKNINKYFKIKTYLLNSLCEKILLKKIIKLIKIFKILKKKNMYFEKFKFGIIIKKFIDDFFEKVFILCDNIILRNNRLKIIYVLNYILNKDVNFENKDIYNLIE